MNPRGSMVERLTTNQEAVGSSPTWDAFLIALINHIIKLSRSCLIYF